MTGGSPAASAIAGLIGFALLFALGVALLRWLQKRLGRPLGSSSGDIRVLRRFPLGWQSVLMVVEVAGRQYVLTTSRHGQVTLIDELTEPLDAAAPAVDFGERLKRALDKRRNRR